MRLALYQYYGRCTSLPGKFKYTPDKYTSNKTVLSSKVCITAPSIVHFNIVELHTYCWISNLPDMLQFKPMGLYLVIDPSSGSVMLTFITLYLGFSSKKSAAIVWSYINHKFRSNIVTIVIKTTSTHKMPRFLFPIS